MDVRNRVSNESRLAGNFEQVHKGKRSISQFNGEFDYSALRTYGSDFNASDRRIQSRFLRNNPHIIVSGSSALLQESNNRKDTNILQDPGNSLKPSSSSKLRFQEIRKKLSPHRLNTCDPNSSISNNKKDLSSSSKTTEFLSIKGTLNDTVGTSTASREVKHYAKTWPKIDQSLAQSTCNLINKMAKQTLKKQGQQVNTQTVFPYADPLQGASVKFMQRISEISLQEAETKRLEQGAGKWRKKN